MITLSVGGGTTSDNFSDIDWSSGSHFLKIEVDPFGGSSYLIEDTSQLLSVPYALYAGGSTSSNNELLLYGENYLSYSNNELTLKKIELSSNVNGILPVTSGGTGTNSAPMISLITSADALSARAALNVDISGTDNSTPASLATVTDNYLTLAGQEITAGTVPITLGGTGSTTAPMVGVITAADAAAARTVLGITSTGDDNSDPVTLAAVNGNYLTLAGQELTAGTVPVALGGTGSTTAPMIGVITAADAAAARTAIGTGSIATQSSDAIDVDGGAIDGTVIGANAPSTGIFTSVNSGIVQSVGNTDIIIKTGNDTTGTITLSNGPNENINIAPHGTGKVKAGPLTFPAADGTANQILKTDGSGNLSFTDQKVSTPVTLATVTDNYLTISGQEITSGMVPVALGGTGSSTAPMVGVITASDAAAARTAIGTGSIATQNSDTVD